MPEIPKFTSQQEEAEFLDKTEAVDVIFVDTRSSSKQTWLQQLYMLFASVRTQAQVMDEAEIDALIDQAVDEVRS